jgi:hypothetical protein
MGVKEETRTKRKELCAVKTSYLPMSAWRNSDSGVKGVPLSFVSSSRKFQRISALNPALKFYSTTYYDN